MSCPLPSPVFSCFFPRVPPLSLAPCCLPLHRILYRAPGVSTGDRWCGGLGNRTEGGGCARVCGVCGVVRARHPTKTTRKKRGGDRVIIFCDKEKKSRETPRNHNGREREKGGNVCAEARHKDKTKTRACTLFVCRARLLPLRHMTSRLLCCLVVPVLLGWLVMQGSTVADGEKREELGCFGFGWGPRLALAPRLSAPCLALHA